MRGKVITKIPIPMPPKMNTTQSQKYGEAISTAVSFGYFICELTGGADAGRRFHRIGGREFSGDAF